MLSVPETVNRRVQSPSVLRMRRTWPESLLRLTTTPFGTLNATCLPPDWRRAMSPLHWKL